MIKILLHFLMCYFIADVVYNLLPTFIGKDEYWQPIIPTLIACGVACLAGIGKELWDKYHDKESINAGDLTMDFMGAGAWLVMPLIGQIFPWK